MNHQIPTWQSEPLTEFEEVIAGLTTRTTENTNTGFPVGDLQEDIQKCGQLPEIPVDQESMQRISELRGITDRLAEKLIVEPPNIDFSRYSIPYDRELNQQQLAAVTTTNRPLLVIAGAGSGKTRVITYKVAYLIESGISPSQILLLTFTRKAANEMLDRVKGLLAGRVFGDVLGGTFHSFANHALRQYGQIIGLPSNFNIIDTEDTADIIDLLKTELGISRKKAGPVFPQKSKVQTIISRAKNLEMTISDVVHEYFEENIPFINDISLLAGAAHQYKVRSNLLDYDDLMMVLRDGLRDNEPFRLAVKSSLRHILVDEYQDTNKAQREIVELLSGGSVPVTVVGDDAQSIYGFRGANFENILRFPQRFPDCGVVMVEQNYRSDQGILDFCNDVIAAAQIGFPKRLYSTRSTGRKPEIRRFADGPAEAEFIVDQMLDIKQNDLDYKDFAVLTRASWHSNFVQAELMKRGIPFIVVGGIKFSERRHVRDMVALIKIILNPMDAVSWHRALKLIEGVGNIRAKEIIDVVHSNNGHINLSGFSSRKYYPELTRLQGALNDIIDNQYPVPCTVELLLNYYRPILEQLEDDSPARVRDLDVFSVIAGKYDDLERFVSEFALDPPSNRYQDENTPLIQPDEKPMVVSTIHSAKGLEWHTVFLPFALDGLIPSVRALETIEDLEEERRLFYVGCSRAKENLFITMPAYLSSWDEVFTMPSRFIYDVDSRHYSAVD